MAMASINLEMMAGLVRQAERAREDACTTQSRLSSALSSVMLDDPAPARLSGVAAWLDGQIPGLRRRLALAQAIEARTPGWARYVQIDESTLVTTSPEQARADARRTAELLADFDDGDVPDEALDLLAAYADDPYFAHALATAMSTQTVPDLVLRMSRERELFQQGLPDAEQMAGFDDQYTRLLDGLGGSLGLATHGSGDLALPADYAKSWSVAMTAPPPTDGGDGQYGMAGALGLVVAHGSWSTPFLTDVAGEVYEEERRAGEDGRRVWDPRSYPQGSGYVGAVAPDGSYAYDPLASVLSAMGRNPPAAAQFLGSGGMTTVPVDGQDVTVSSVLKYLMTERRWPVDGAAGAKDAAVAAITPSLGASSAGTTIASQARAVLDYRAAELEAREDDGGNWFSDIGHGVLDVLGLVPALGEPADAVNGAWYLAEGDTTNAALSAAALIPFAGWGATGGKWVNNVAGLGDGLIAGARGLDGLTALERRFEAGLLVGQDAAQRQRLLDELAAAGVKHEPSSVMRIARTQDGRVIFLESGNPGAGFVHVLRHQNDFAQVGVRAVELPDYIFSALLEGRMVGRQGAPPGRPVYEFMWQGEKRYLAVDVGNNGFVVGANPRSGP